jgi:tRNA (guanine-N7-)-methyltransferase
VPKKKLIHFRENLYFKHLFQPGFHHLVAGFEIKSHWHDRFFRNEYPIVAEFGCGKGEYTIGLATAYPGKNFVGIDWKGARLWRGCKTVEEQKLTNVCFVRALIDHVEMIFAPGEISEIWITFPDPQPKRERRRLTAPVFLHKYRNILAKNGIVHLKTDNVEFYQYTLDIIRDYRHRLLWATNDLYRSGCKDDVVTIQTYYERIWLGMGKKICYLKFQLGEE